MASQGLRVGRGRRASGVRRRRKPCKVRFFPGNRQSIFHPRETDPAMVAAKCLKVLGGWGRGVVLACTNVPSRWPLPKTSGVFGTAGLSAVGLVCVAWERRRCYWRTRTETWPRHCGGQRAGGRGNGGVDRPSLPWPGDGVDGGRRSRGVDVPVFEAPCWAGDRPVECDRERGEEPYALPFHPLELGKEALRALFGFLLEGRPLSEDVDPDEVPLLGFRLLADSNEPSIRHRPGDGISLRQVDDSRLQGGGDGDGPGSGRQVHRGGNEPRLHGASRHDAGST
ncbi:DUF6928 family protein [Streptomyces sp. NPDC056488]|uniref:DUF6928 family protein n=1 Tax=unclassified Streptomyces TaxID=2593676 RepID=UPI003687300A